MVGSSSVNFVASLQQDKYINWYAFMFSQSIINVTVLFKFIVLMLLSQGIIQVRWAVVELVAWIAYVRRLYILVPGRNKPEQKTGSYHEQFEKLALNQELANWQPCESNPIQLTAIPPVFFFFFLIIYLFIYFPTPKFPSHLEIVSVPTTCFLYIKVFTGHKIHFLIIYATFTYDRGRVEYM